VIKRGVHITGSWTHCQATALLERRGRERSRGEEMGEKGEQADLTPPHMLGSICRRGRE
jgi:hypothetical protein